MEKTNKKGFLAWFTDNWKRKPLFSTGIALLVMVILQMPRLVISDFGLERLPIDHLLFKRIKL